MKPFTAVQALLNIKQNKKELLGSCFQLQNKKFYITAQHCVKGLQASDIEVMNPVKNYDIPCKAIHRHPKADLALLEIQGEIPEVFENFTIVKSDSFVGFNVHCFGIIPKNEHIKTDAPARCVGGIVQRDFLYKDKDYEFLAFEFSSPIPKGMSGAPAFVAKESNLVVGIATGTIKNEVVVDEFIEYENKNLIEREKISNIIRYGVILRLKPLEDWIKKIMNNV